MRPKVKRKKRTAPEVARLMKPKVKRTKQTPPEVARSWGISPEKVIGWIKRGELRAINIATRPGGRPRYLVDVADLAVFEQKRTVGTTAITRPPHRKKTIPGLIEFF